MSAPGTLQIKPLQQAVQPTVPNTLPVATTPSTPAVTVPMATPPSVNDGGAATFSGLTGTLQDLLKAKQAEISASADTLKANNAVDATTATQLGALSTETLSAFHNIERIESLPGGVNGKLAKIIGLFDSDYNPEMQRTVIEERQLRANQITLTADSIKAQNNQLPQLLGKVTEAAQASFSAFRDINTLAIQQGNLDNELIRTKIQKAELGLKYSAEQRAATEFKIRSMSTDQVSAALQQGLTGKGPWSGMTGFLQDRLVSERAAEASLSSAENAARQGNRDEYNNSLSDFVGHLPTDLVSAALADAQRKGEATVNFPTGKDDKGKLTFTAVPIPIVQAGLVKSADIDAKANAVVASDYAGRLNLIPNATALVGGANGLASMDPRATSIVTNTMGILHSLDPKNPNSVRQTSIFIDNQKAQLDTIAKSIADKFSTPEAKAAVMHFGQTGSFDPQGGSSVVIDSIGVPAYNTQTLYRSAFTQMNTLLATAIQKQHLVNSNGLDPNSAGDAQAMIAGLLQKPDTRFTIRNLATEILSNPGNQKMLANTIAGVIRPKAINDTLQQLAAAQNANPIWKDIYDHANTTYIGYAQNADGTYSNRPVVNYQKLFETLEQASVRTGGKINYANTFLTAMRNYAVNIDNSPTSDPSYTMVDHALEAAVYGGRPHSAVLGDFVGALAQQASRAHADMQKRIQDDLAGRTIQQATDQNTINNAAPGLMLGVQGAMFNDPTLYMKHTGVDPSKVPSATGTGMTTYQIKQLYGGGH